MCQLKTRCRNRRKPTRPWRQVQRRLHSLFEEFKLLKGDMSLSVKGISLLVVFIFTSHYVSILESVFVEEKPSVVVVILARNEEHTLPLFLNLFEKINYPKNKLSLFIRSDHNVDGTNEILHRWLSGNKNEYQLIDVDLKYGRKVYDDEHDGQSFWSLQRRMQLIHIRQEGLEEARKKGADFVWFLDADAFIRDPFVLQKLILEGETITAPMLTSMKAYANFWGDMTETFWYKRSENYTDILTYKNKGCFPVSRVSKCVLINLNHEDSKVLSFQPSGLSKFKDYENVPALDYTILALSARENHINIYVCNKEQSGNMFFESIDLNDPVDVEILQISQLGMEHLNKWDLKDTENTELIISKDDTTSTPSKQNLGFDKAYFINLARRPERKERMEKLLHSYGVNATWFQAYDWLDLNVTFLGKMGMKPLNTYRDNDLTLGMAAHFLTHYALWEEVVKKEYKQVMILEDDIVFEPDFNDQVNRAMSDISRLNFDWDLVYLGRKIHTRHAENPVYGSDILVKSLYSHWSIGYLLSYQGAKKLVDQKPLKKFLPTDEYISIMCGVHPVAKWSEHFGPTDLKSFAVKPSIIEPMFYRNDEGYISDALSSPMWADFMPLDTDNFI